MPRDKRPRRRTLYGVSRDQRQDMVVHFMHRIRHFPPILVAVVDFGHLALVRGVAQYSRCDVWCDIKLRCLR